MRAAEVTNLRDAFAAVYAPQALAPWPMTVRQVLDISTLGYEYAAQVIG